MGRRQGEMKVMMPSRKEIRYCKGNDLLDVFFSIPEKGLFYGKTAGMGPPFESFMQKAP